MDAKFLYSGWDYIIAKSVRSLLTAVVILMVSTSAAAYDIYPRERRDSLPVMKPDLAHFDVKQLIVPGTLIITGTLGVYDNAVRRGSVHVSSEVSNMGRNGRFHIDDYMQYVPTLSYFALGSLGVRSKHRFRERLAVGITANLAMVAMIKGGKRAFRQKRPDSDAENSFPSGHSAVVFTGAEMIRAEYPAGIGIAAYVTASAVGFLRIYNGRHRLNEVVAGTGIGILSARIGYWMLPVYRRWFGWEEPGSRQGFAMVMPSYDPDTHAALLSMAIRF